MGLALRICLAVLGVAAIAIAGSILVLGAQETAWSGERVYAALAHYAGPLSEPWPPSMDSELRFYAALWGAYGMVLLWVARRLEQRLPWVPGLATVFFAGGVGRVLSLLNVGAPHPFFLALMAIELGLPVVMVGLWLGVRRR